MVWKREKGSGQRGQVDADRAVQGRRASRLGGILPQEHGSWIMFGISSISGLLAAGRGWGWGALAVGVALLFFVSRRPLSLYLRGRERRFLAWGMGLMGGGGALALLLLAERRWLVVPLGMAGAGLMALDLWRVRVTARPTAWSEAAGVAGLALVSSLVYYSATGEWDQKATTLFLACLLHYLSAVSFVRTKASWVAIPSADLVARVRRGWPNLLAQAAIMGAARGLDGLGIMIPGSWVALLPAFIRGFGGGLFGKRERNFVLVGLKETGYSLIFLLLLLWMVRNP